MAHFYSNHTQTETGGSWEYYTGLVKVNKAMSLSNIYVQGRWGALSGTVSVHPVVFKRDGNSYSRIAVGSLKTFTTKSEYHRLTFTTPVLLEPNIEYYVGFGNRDMPEDGGLMFTVQTNLNEGLSDSLIINGITVTAMSGIRVFDRNYSTGLISSRAYIYMELSGKPPNKVPTINITSPGANQTFHENSTLTMAGSAVDTDADDVVTIKYQIDSGTVRNLHSAVSDGTTPIDFTKSLTYKDGALYDGVNAVTSTLDKDVPHSVSMWAEDGKGGKSPIVTRSFFVVPNRAPQVTISPITQQSELINSDVINISGAVVDLDHNDVTVTFSINGSEEQHVLTGPPSAFTFNILLANLKTGANTVIVKATDTYNMSGTKTLTIHKTHDAVPINTAVARYQIVAPTGSAQSILLWVTRTLGNLGINAAVSLTNANEAENYVDLTPTNTGIVNGNREDEFAYQGTVSKEKIILKITYNRTDANVIDTIKQISGVLF